MKLSYRGISYEETPVTLDITEGGIGGTYRGHSWRVHKARLIRRHPAPLELTYRGATYKRS
ncbi:MULTISPECIES: DUF4278 domain-containing protein [unclassified Coleofasciculus]|uniref:DUF4278 domain-containing protein n=1 Tax=unclassified Coleofasciculus TaxID=2692782 RepID=UPI001881B50A|nr:MULTISPECIES: DUF4278 domain-containing protein [unclassified Coleofasciculus]MBE9124838.1 DUF4278 domain-containing protein [Coleofasciculus sp. LEGE 07081]MBE9147743.1 DUF4278 domain-containing protein [Coleofasciculus sp. LEGE 07092]